MIRLPVLPMPLVPTTIIRIGRCFVCRPNFANDDLGDVEFIVSFCFVPFCLGLFELQVECGGALVSRTVLCAIHS